MTISLRTAVAPAVLALGAAGALLGASATSALAAKPTVHHAVAGVVVSTNAKAHELVVRVGTSDDHFRDSAATKVVVAGKRAPLASVKRGEKVTVTYTVAGKVWTATAVTAKKA